MRRSIPLLLAAALVGCSREQPAAPPAETGAPPVVTRAVFQAGGASVNLPKAVGPWSRPDAPKVVTAETIFDYMDGAGELYVAYRFDHLDVFEYKAADASLGTILVELYWMKGPDDAFGLLSTDWGGEVPDSDPGSQFGSAAVPVQRALYGAGLLRMCNGQLFARLLATRETPRSREAVLAIGREIRVAPAPPPPPPVLLSALRGSPGDGGTVRPDRTCFFRSHLVLNSVYYLASEDILGLGLDVEAVTTEYRPATSDARPTRSIFVRYPSAARARGALKTFAQAYLPETARGRIADTGTTRLEQGWAGWMLQGPDLAIALDASSEASARRLLASTLAAAAPAATIQ